MTGALERRFINFPFCGENCPVAQTLLVSGDEA